MDKTDDQPPSGLTSDRNASADAEGVPISESVELVRAFLAIADPRDRTAVIELARRLAGRKERGAA